MIKGPPTEVPKLSWGEVKGGFLEEVVPDLRPERHVRCLGEEDTVPAFVAFYWMSKYTGMYHVMC